MRLLANCVFTPMEIGPVETGGWLLGGGGGGGQCTLCRPSLASCPCFFTWMDSRVLARAKLIFYLPAYLLYLLASCFLLLSFVCKIRDGVHSGACSCLRFSFDSLRFAEAALVNLHD